MTGAADGRLRDGSVERPLNGSGRPGHSNLADLRVPASDVDLRVPASDVDRPVALLVAGDIDPGELSRRLDSHFHMIATTNLPAAVSVLGEVRLDFVLIDAALPDPAMMELITQVRVRQWLRDLPIICYGTAAPGSAVSRLAGLAAHDVIVEPVSTGELVARISAALSAGD
jgi:PleD family two-component response regulator